MPTPNDTEGPVISPATIEIPAQSSFASCPPDESRGHHAPREERIESASPSPSPSPSPAGGALEAGTGDEERSTAQEAPAESEAQRSTEAAPVTVATTHERAEHIEDAGIPVDSPICLSSQDAPGENEAKLAHSMAVTAIAPAEDEPLYLDFSGSGQRYRHPNFTSSFLRPGSKFRGTQQSDRQKYDVQVEIKDVDMEESFLCGYLRIEGLAEDHPTLTTFFEGEIIGPRYRFRTEHPSWNTSEKVDMQHWARFPAWRPLAKSAKSPNFTLKDHEQRDHLFMRLKERFLVPDHRVKTITGASFDGFYYCCYSKSAGTISGIYFHAKSEKYQRLELLHVDDRGCMGAIEFR